ncbi:MAG TPA: hypothetical protein VHG28_03270, partial [Longimicrobiaceae bacterium]|nr:hypothetical protein [Longimicrobiaceae bacterium]
SVTFDTALADATVAELLRRHGVRAAEVFTIAGGMDTQHRVYPGQPADSAIADARLSTIEYAQGMLCSAPRRIEDQLSQNPALPEPEPGVRERTLRGQLAEAEWLRAALAVARSGRPVIYGVTVVGTAERLDGLAGDPLVGAVERGNVSVREGQEFTVVSPPRRPAGAGGLRSLPPQIEALPMPEVRRRLEAIVREGFPECREYALERGGALPRSQAERATFVCDWHPARPAAERIIADVRLRSGDANRTPTEVDLRGLRSAGARVLHLFNVAMVRVEIPTDRIATLVRGPDPVAEWAATVPDPRNFDVEVQIFYGRPPQSSDLRALEGLGARVLGGLGVRGVVYAVVPDAAIPRIARLPRVTNVRAQAMGCAQALEARPGG